jgi:hypothetical protein
VLKSPAPILGIEALDLMRRVEGGHFVAFDVVEVLSAVDPSQTTAALAANIAYEFMTFVALQKRAVADEPGNHEASGRAHGHTFGVRQPRGRTAPHGRYRFCSAKT